MPRKPLKAEQVEAGEKLELRIEVPVSLTIDALAQLLAAIYGTNFATRDKRFGEQTIRSALRTDAGRVLLAAFLAPGAADEQIVSWYRAKLVELKIFPAE